MKKILVFADGIIAKHFLQRVLKNMKIANQQYSIVYMNNETLPKNFEHPNITTHKFDPTSKVKLDKLMNSSYTYAFILLENKLDSVTTYDYVRAKRKTFRIIFLDKWDLEFDDKYIQLISPPDIMSGRLIQFLPDVPMIAQNIGLGIGEIMQIAIPFGSSYAYRHLIGIRQDGWSIVALYRGGRMILPKSTMMLEPNDSILVIGKPSILKNVYANINKKAGQFPMPFGGSIYVMLDMMNMSEERMLSLIDKSIVIFKMTNANKIIFKVINPTINKTLEKLNSYENVSILVYYSYAVNNKISVIKNDIANHDIGLIIVDKDCFIANKNELFNIKKPILKTGDFEVEHLKKSLLFLADDVDVEKTSSLVFDISTQLNLTLELAEYDPNDEADHTQVIEHYESLSNIFNKKIEIEKYKQNPLFTLKDTDGMLQFIPFKKKVSRGGFFSLLSDNINSKYSMLYQSYQLFLPLSEDDID